MVIQFIGMAIETAEDPRERLSRHPLIYHPAPHHRMERNPTEQQEEPPDPARLPRPPKKDKEDGRKQKAQDGKEGLQKEEDKDEEQQP